MITVSLLRFPHCNRIVLPSDLANAEALNAGHNSVCAAAGAVFPQHQTLPLRSIPPIIFSPRKDGHALSAPQPHPNFHPGVLEAKEYSWKKSGFDGRQRMKRAKSIHLLVNEGALLLLPPP